MEAVFKQKAAWDGMAGGLLTARGFPAETALLTQACALRIVRNDCIQETTRLINNRHEANPCRSVRVGRCSTPTADERKRELGQLSCAADGID